MKKHFYYKDSILLVDCGYLYGSIIMWPYQLSNLCYHSYMTTTKAKILTRTPTHFDTLGIKCYLCMAQHFTKDVVCY